MFSRESPATRQTSLENFFSSVVGSLHFVCVFIVVKNQILTVLDKINVKSIKKVIVAYEPVWAIGTGKTATPRQAQEMHCYIRNLIKEKFGLEISETIKIIYGGSCNKNNAKDLFKQKDIDGGLVGGASLIFDDFIEIVRIGELF